jgi:hypothetical protein
MIIEPDFFEHWKVKALIELTKRPESPLWVQRLWAHCQTRKAWRFRDLPDIAIKSICSVPIEIEAATWVAHLVQCRFIIREGDTCEVHDWKKHNSKLVANWANGGKSKRHATRSQAEANQKPTTPQSDIGAGDRLDRLDGLDRVEGEDKRESEDRAPRAQAGKPASFQEVEAYASEIGLSREEALKFFDHFEANGWRQGGRTAIKDWRASARNWSRRAGEFGASGASSLGKSRGGRGGAAAPFDPKTPHAHTGGLEVFNEGPAVGGAGGGA